MVIVISLPTIVQSLQGARPVLGTQPRYEALGDLSRNR